MQCARKIVNLKRDVNEKGRFKLSYNLTEVRDSDHTLVRLSSNFETIDEIIGKLRIFPMTGILRRNSIVAGRKPPNRRMNPYVSTIMPTRGYPRSTTAIPAKNATVALTLCL